jgi:DNA-binding response OmpR family regulator
VNERDCIVLVADDDEDMREVLVDILQSEGYRVLSAEDGPQALRKALEARPHVILLDHRMPGMLGADVYRAIRELGCESGVIFATAAREGPQLARSLGIGCFLQKPFDMEQCLAAIDSLCD